MTATCKFCKTVAVDYREWWSYTFCGCDIKERKRLFGLLRAKRFGELMRLGISASRITANNGYQFRYDSKGIPIIVDTVNNFYIAEGSEEDWKPLKRSKKKSTTKLDYDNMKEAFGRLGVEPAKYLMIKVRIDSERKLGLYNEIFDRLADLRIANTQADILKAVCRLRELLPIPFEMTENGQCFCKEDGLFVEEN